MFSRLFIVVSLLWSAPAFACPPDWFEAVADIFDYPTLYAESVARTVTALRGHRGGYTGVEARPRERASANGQQQLEIFVLASGWRGTGAVLEYIIRENRVTYWNVDVPEDFRELGFNRVLLLQMLVRHPNITELPATLLDTNLGNLVAACNGATGDKIRELGADFVIDDTAKERAIDGLLARINALRTTAQVIAFRERALAAYRRDVPTARIMESVGFRIRSMRFEFGTENGPMQIDVEATRGPDWPNANIPISVVDETVTPHRRFSLNADGSITHP